MKKKKILADYEAKKTREQLEELIKSAEKAEQYLWWAKWQVSEFRHELEIIAGKRRPSFRVTDITG